MWIVILNFCLFILIIGFMFYGFGKWDELITDYSDNTSDKNRKDEAVDIVDGTYNRLPIWILLIGVGISQLVSIIQNILEK